MLPTAFRRSIAKAAVTKTQQRGLTRPLNDNLIAYAEGTISLSAEKPNPITDEAFATGLAVATAAYVAYAYSRPAKDTKLFNFQGEFALPIVTPALNWFMDKLTETTIKQLPGVDPFENFTEEEKMDRLRQLDSAGYFNRFWQDQNDDIDKMRIMENTTTLALMRRVTLAKRFPNTAYTLEQIAHHAQLLETTKQPQLNIPVGESIVTLNTPLDRNAAAFVYMVESANEDDATFTANKSAYAKAMGL